VRERYAAIGITALPRLGFNNTFAILVRRADAERLGLKTISDLNRVKDWRAGFGYEFLERPDGFKGLAAAYGLQFANQPRVMDLNLIYRAVASQEIDVTAGDATSGLIEALDLVALDDDRRYFPVYDAVPVARAAVLLQHPGVVAALRHLEGAISADEMQRMNYAVDGEKRTPAEVVRAFLDTIESFYGQPR
jgi:glycine betaine/choline ABC-type transport system substrate-binding protein